MPFRAGLRAAAAAALIFPVVAGAACPPGTVARGVYTKYCYPVAGGSAGASGGYGSAGAQLGQQIGSAGAELIRGALFGDPQQEAERRAAMEWEEQERLRMAAERARQDDARYERLRTSLLDFNPGPQLSLMGAPSSGGLQLMLGEDAERSLNPAFAELTRAAAWSSLAAGANTPEDAAMFAEAAFQSAIGAKVNLPPPPPDVKGVPVGPLVRDIEPIKKQYLDLRQKLPETDRPLLDAEYRKELAIHAEEEARAAEKASKQAAERARAREAVAAAQRLRRQAEEEVRLARAESERRQQSSNDAERRIREMLAAPPGGMGADSRNDRKKDTYFFRGHQDGSLCFASNAANFCRSAPESDRRNCLDSYTLGYRAGEKLKTQMITDAGESGRRDKQGGRPYNGFADSRSDGPCRITWVKAYNDGYFGWRINFAGR
jgi:hypothetical protein